MGIDPVTATIGAAVLGAVMQGVQGNRQESQARRAQAENKSQAEKLYAQQDQENNRRNARGPNVDALFASNALEGQQGGGTMLTGPGGINPDSLDLSRNTLLGG